MENIWNFHFWLAEWNTNTRARLQSKAVFTNNVVAVQRGESYQICNISLLVRERLLTTLLSQKRAGRRSLLLFLVIYRGAVCALALTQLLATRLRWTFWLKTWCYHRRFKSNWTVKTFGRFDDTRRVLWRHVVILFSCFFCFVFGGFEHWATIGIHWMDFDSSRYMAQTMSTEPLSKCWWAESDNDKTSQSSDKAATSSQ